MTKNITVGVSDELAEQMVLFPEVNWSAVTRDCIMQYIKNTSTIPQLLHPLVPLPQY